MRSLSADAQILNFFDNADAVAHVFDQQFWPLYPRHTGKGAARASFAKALEVTDLPTIMQALELFAQHPESVPGKPSSIPMASTWLNQTRWEDDPPPTIAPKPLEPRLSTLGPRETCGSCDAGWLFDDDGTVMRCPTCG